MNVYRSICRFQADFSRIAAIAAIGLALTGAPLAGVARAQDAATELTDADRQAAIERISVLLQERYVFADVAEQCASHLQAELGAGAFDSMSDPEAFAQGLTESLQSISHDKHMRVRVRRPDTVEIERENPARAMARQRSAAQSDNYGFYKVERLDGNIGYIDMRYFSGSPEARATASAAMNFLAHVDAVIFDMRRNGGGNPEMIRFLTSYLFDEPTHLNSLYWRQGDQTQEFWTFDEVPGSRLGDVPVFVLTSDFTFSGAEEFTYNLKTRKRATVIGETTGGGANPGGVVPIDDRFAIFIPTGRAINPVTNTNWEGTGVEPDIKVDESEALDEAIRLAVVAAQDRRNAAEAAIDARWKAYETASGRAAELLEQGDRDAAMAAMQVAVEAAHSAGLLHEPDINVLGYEFMGRGQLPLAIGVFSANVALYPDSANVYDSLGEAYMNDGQNELAIANYTRSLDLDPDNQNAREMLSRLNDSR